MELRDKNGRFVKGNEGYWLGKKRTLSPEHIKNIQLANECGKNTKNYRVNQKGYIKIFMPEHPSSNTKGYIEEHRLIMEEKIGRYLKKKEVVHHVNGVTDDNRIENLKLYATNGQHLREHKYPNRKKKAS